MDSPKAGLMPLGERVQAALEAETHPAEQLRVARSQLLDRVTSEPRHTPRRASQRFAYAGLAAFAGLALAFGFAQWSSRPISFATAGTARAIGDALEAPTRAPLQVEFSEGSHMLLQKGARARVLETQATGARVLLESGATDVSIAHRSDQATRWRFEAGPFQVLVKGTQFELDWQPVAQVLVLKMKTGSVELSGSCLAAPRIVERGAALRLSCAKPEALKQPLATAPAQAAPAPVMRVSAKGKPTAQVDVREGHEGNEAPPSFEASCETASKADLVAWANQARLAGNTARARTALLALRRRFVGSSDAGTAAFTLGRMAFDRQADYAEAARWFSLYLAEQPTGPLMGDAAGRLLEAHERQGDRAAARKDAQAYVRRFPDGPYADRARRILAE